MNEIRDGLVGAVGNTPLIRLRGALVCENGNPVGKPRGRYFHRQPDRKKPWIWD